MYLTKEIILCDCPGLVFPAMDRPKALQILCGLFPIAQVREPFSAIRYLAERVAIEKVYGLQYPDLDDKQWTPFYLCEAFALKRGYFVRKGRPDVHRAGLEILRDCVDGVIPISWPPPSIPSIPTIPSSISSSDVTNQVDQLNENDSINDEFNSDDDEEEEEEEIISKSTKKKLKKKLQKKKLLEETVNDLESTHNNNLVKIDIPKVKKSIKKH